MAKVILLPKLGYTQDEGAVIEWHKQVGDAVKKGEPFFDSETDKSTVSVEATADGTVLKLLLDTQVTVPVYTPIAVIGEPGEDPDAALAEFKGGASEPEKETAETAEPEAAAPVEASPKKAEAAPRSAFKMSPRALRYVYDNGIELDSCADIKGTGFEGGVTERDVIAYFAANPNASQRGAGERRRGNTAAPQDVGGKTVLSDVPYSGVRKLIGERLSDSKFTAPHLYFTDSVDTTELTKLRRELNARADTPIGVSDLLIKAASTALQKFPGINSSLVDGHIISYKSTNVGIAVAGDHGLVVPVVKDAQSKSISAISKETRDLVERGKKGRLKSEEYNGGTFSISNLGMFGIGNFTAIINPPESAILSVSSVRKTPVVLTDAEGVDSIVIRPMMNIQLSVDHRIIDGLLASQFLEYLKYLLENPLQILVYTTLN